MTRIKESKFPIVALIGLLTAIAFLCLLFPIGIADAGSDGDSLKIKNVLYTPSQGFTVQTNDNAGPDAEISLISVYDKNGNELKIDPGSILYNGKRLFFTIENSLSAQINGGKIVFGRNFCVSQSSGLKLASEIVMISGAEDEETGTIQFNKTEQSEPVSAAPTEKESVQKIKPDEQTSQSEDFPTESESSATYQSGSESTSEIQSDSESTETAQSDPETASEPKSQSVEIPEDYESGKESGKPDYESNEESSEESSEKSIKESAKESAKESGDNSGKITTPPYKTDKSDKESGGNNKNSDECQTVLSVAIGEFKVEKDAYVLKIGEKATVAITVLPENATEKYSFVFTNEGIAGYEESVLKGIAAGETELVFKAENTEKRIKITVTDSDVTDDKVYTVTPVFGEAMLEIGLPGNITVSDHVYSEDEMSEAATFIDANGCKVSVIRTESASGGSRIVIGFVANGENAYAIIGKGFPIYSSLNGGSVKLGKTANAVGTRLIGGKTEEIVYCEKIIVPKKIKILLFQTEKLDVKTVPENVNIWKPIYSSDNNETAAVDEDGNVTAIARGKCKITVTFNGADGKIIEETVDVEVYDEIVDITRNTDIVLTIRDDKIIADDLEFTLTYKSGLVITKTIQNATLSYRKDENGKFIGTISFTEDGKDYSFDIPVSLNFSDCGSGCGGGCGSAISGNQGLLTGYSIVFVLSAVFVFINIKIKHR